MSDLRDDFDRIVNAIGQYSLLLQLRDKVLQAQALAAPKCGRCSHWMKSRICPREKNVNGISRGPSCNASPCDQFQWQPQSKALIKERAADAVEFARKHRLPVPEHLQETET